MKKIYMILAAMSLLTMSLNAQLLPDKQRSGSRNATPTGIAYQYTPNSQFRMPSLGSGEYLFGPYTTDEFDATGASLYNLYNRAQNVTAVVDMTRSEFEEHLGDQIIGFRFALAGSTPVQVYDFGMYPANDDQYADESTVWNLGTLMGGNTSSSTETTTAHSDITIVIANGNFDFRRIAVETTSGTTVTEWNYQDNNTNLPNSNWTCNNTILQEDNDSYWISGGGTITISAAELAGVTDPVRVVINGKTYNSQYYSSTVTVNGSSQTITNYSTWTNYTWGSFNPTTQTVTTNTVEVGRGATKYEYLPVSGWNIDYGYHNQMIYRAGQLAMASGAVINSITFYPEEGIGIPFSGAPVIVKLANITNDNFGTGTSGTMISSGLTTVATITPVADHDATAWKIDFATPFTYNGGNLLVDMSCAGNGQFAHANFLGDNQSANVSLTAHGNGTVTATTGATSTFLPKATFAFTGDVNTPQYLTLQPGEWHDFFLEEPVEFTVPDGYDYLSIGYTYYQQYSSSFAPVAYNSNSTGHDHWGYGYSRQYNYGSYSQGWWNIGSYLNGDLAVQLIFKSQMEQTPAPTITYTYDNGYYYVTATAPTSDPQAVVTLEVNGTTVSGTGQVQIPIGRGDTDRTVTATATAQADGKTASDPVTQEITILASPLDPTPAPTISSQVHDLTVEVNGSGQGEVHMYVDGREVPTTYYLERGTEDYYVTVAVTAQIQDTQHSMSTTTQQVLVPKLDNLDELISGWTELPGTYTNDKVINWNDNLMFIDRFTASTAQNDHPAKYTYVMTEDDIKLIGEPRTTNEHIIPVMKTGSQVSGIYTASDINADTDRSMPMRTVNGNVEMLLEQSTDIYYYTLDRAINDKVDFLELSKLQNRRDDYYTEMDNYYTYGENIYIGKVFRDDTIGGIADNKTWGEDYRSYVPIVWTMGNDVSNTRANWENDHLHNSYGSPIWMNSVGKVELNSCGLERQKGKYGSTNWLDSNNDSCSLYMLQVDAFGYLPEASVCNVDYKPYMFRVFVESPTGKLRGYSQVLEPGTDVDNTGEPGSHLVYDPSVDHNKLCVYQEMLDPTVMLERYHLAKPKSNTWDENIRFGGLNSIKDGDINVYVRFYFLVEDALPGQGNFLRATRGDGPGGAGAEGSGDPGDPQTGINEFVAPNHGEIVDQIFFNAQGMRSSQPFDGINIVVTRYSDGTTSTSKIVRR